MRKDKVRVRVLSGCVAMIAALALGATAHAKPAGNALSIINGTSVTAGQIDVGGRWNSLAAIVTRSVPNAWGGQFCGGTLIAPRWVLTAAHCVFGDYDENGSTELAAAASMDVVLGRRDLTTGGGARINVDLVVPHHTYVPDVNTVSDIALLRLAQDVPASVAQPMQLVGADDNALWANGQTLHIAGWGNRTPTLCPAGGGTCPDADEPDWPTIPDETSITRTADSTCSSGPAPGYSYFNAVAMLCAGVLDTDGNASSTNGRDTCQGDSGGPLIADPGTGASNMRLVGVTSFGRGCGSVNYGVYARVASFTTWIANAMNGAVPSGGDPAPTGDGGSGGGSPTLRGDDSLSAPGNVYIDERTLTSVTVAWDEPTSGGPIASYIVDWGIDSDEFSAEYDGYVIGDLRPGRSVSISIQAVNEDGDVSPKATITTTTLRDTRAPKMSAAPGVKRVGRGAAITWKAAKDDHVIAKYRIVAKVGAKWRTLATVPGSKRALKIRALPPKTSQIAVQAVDASGNVSARSRVSKLR